MPGRAAPVPGSAVAALFAAGDPTRSPYRQGLSAFPEHPTGAVFGSARFGGYTLTPVRFGGYTVTPVRFGRFGDTSSAVTVGTDAAEIAAATATGGPIAGGVLAVKDLASAFSSGSTRDAQRAARANYFGNLAVAGNVAAAQMILGALVPNVSGNELPMWQVWKNQLQASSTGQNILAQATALGPYWPVGSTDTVTNYPISKNFVQQWANAHPFANTSAVISSSLSNPMVLAIGAAAVVGFLFLRRRR
jgi:hypothetical protein